MVESVRGPGGSGILFIESALFSYKLMTYILHFQIRDTRFSLASFYPLWHMVLVFFLPYLVTKVETAGFWVLQYKRER